MTPRIVDHEQKRRAIYQAALQLFLERGYDRTTMDDIAQKAGIGKGTIYQYVKSKEDFVRMALDDYTRPDPETEKILATSDLSPLEKIRELIIHLIIEVSKVRNSSKVILNLWKGGILQEIVPDKGLKHFYETIRVTVDNLLKEAIIANEVKADISPFTSLILIGLIEGIALQLFVAPETGSYEEIGKAAAELILKGIQKKEGCNS